MDSPTDSSLPVAQPKRLSQVALILARIKNAVNKCQLESCELVRSFQRSPEIAVVVWILPNVIGPFVACGDLTWLTRYLYFAYGCLAITTMLLLRIMIRSVSDVSQFQQNGRRWHLYAYAAVSICVWIPSAHLALKHAQFIADQAQDSERLLNRQDCEALVAAEVFFPGTDNKQEIYNAFTPNAKYIADSYFCKHVGDTAKITVIRLPQDGKYYDSYWEGAQAIANNVYLPQGLRYQALKERNTPAGNGMEYKHSIYNNMFDQDSAGLTACCVVRTQYRDPSRNIIEKEGRFDDIGGDVAFSIWRFRRSKATSDAKLRGLYPWQIELIHGGLTLDEAATRFEELKSGFKNNT